MRRSHGNAKWALGALAAAGLAALSAWAAEPGSREEKTAPPKIDPRAAEQVKKMSDFMARQQAFSVHTEGEVEVVLEDGQKLQFPFESELMVERPNKLRADRRGAMTELQFSYDGREYALYGRRLNMYARAPAPATLDAAIDKARADLGIEAPGADLLYSDAHAGLMEDVVSGRYVGRETVHGEVCEHVAFRGKEVDFQLWIRAGDTPTPCRYVVTTTSMKAQPQYRVDLTRWDLSPKFSDEVFTFRPPPGAEKIDFLTPAEMKKHMQEKRGKGGGR